MHNPASIAASRCTCENWRNPARVLLAVVLWAALVLGIAPAPALAQPAPDAAAHAAQAPNNHAQPAHDAPVSEGGVAKGHTDEEQHGESAWAFAGKIFNFAVLVGLLVYFLRAPVREYLVGRGTQIRTDLITAAAMKDDAAQQIVEIDAKLKQLPAELDMLRARGQQEIAAEQGRIDQAAEAERERLLQQTRREIDLQLRAARRDLVTHAADLAVQVARERIRTRMTTDDQRRLLDRYLDQVTTHA